MMRKKYRVKITEKHVDYVWVYVWVEADSREEACNLAPARAECEYELLWACEVVEEDDE